jgi:glycosyltransferase involved in cell wall biosynthesis
MKVLVISNLFPPHFLGGYEILCAQVCRALQQRGHAVTVLTSDHGLTPREERQERFGAEGIPVYRTLKLIRPFGRPVTLLRWRRWRVSGYNAGVVVAMMARVRPDVVFIWSQLRLTLAGAYAAQAAGMPAVYTLNDEYLVGFLPAPFSWHPRSLAGALLDRWLHPPITLKGLTFEYATCISRRLKDNLLARGVPVERARVIYQAIPLEQFPLKPHPGNLTLPARVLFVGQLHPDKGPQTLIEAAGLIAARHGPDRIRVSIVGEGPSRADLERQASRTQAAIAFLGKIPHARIPEMYRDHDLFVFPSIWQEPFGLTPLEAMASGTPVISTVNGGQGEFIAHGVNALTFKEGDAASLAACLCTMIEDAPLRRRLVATARAMVEQQFSFERYMADLEALLADALEGRKAVQQCPEGV